MISLNCFISMLFMSSILFLNVVVHAQNCKEPGMSAPVNESWFLDQGSKGFYTCMRSGISEAEYANVMTNPKSPIPSTNPSNSICITSEAKVHGNKVSDLAYECSCDDMKKNEKVCISQGGLTSPAPKYLINTFVKTDNATYVAQVTCVSGRIDTWSVLCTSPDQPLSDKLQKEIRVAVGEKEGDKTASAEARNKKSAAELGKITITKGQCETKEPIKGLTKGGVPFGLGKKKQH